MAERKTRRSFTPEYLAEAGRLVIGSGRSFAHVAREVGLGEQLLGRWVQQHRDRSVDSTGELGVDERAALKRLRQEVAELRKDNEFLGKAAAFFASKQPRPNG